MKFTFVLSIIMLSLSTFAQGPGWTANATIIRMVDTVNGGFNVRLTPDVTGCISQSGYGANYASVYPDHPGLKLIKASLLAAYLMEKTISLYFVDSTCKVGEVILGGW